MFFSIYKIQIKNHLFMKKIEIKRMKERDTYNHIFFKMFVNGDFAEIIQVNKNHKLSTILLKKIRKNTYLTKQQLQNEINSGWVKVEVFFNENHSVILEDKPSILKTFEWLYVLELNDTHTLP